jgi:hypothetical protein
MMSGGGDGQSEEGYAALWNPATYRFRGFISICTGTKRAPATTSQVKFPAPNVGNFLRRSMWASQVYQVRIVSTANGEFELYRWSRWKEILPVLEPIVAIPPNRSFM